MMTVAPFGEYWMYLPLKTARGSNGDPARKTGIWLDAIEGTDETLIDTESGVTNCGTVTRLQEGEQWNVEMFKKMRGLPWEPVPGKQPHHIPVAIEEDGAVMDEETETTSPNIKFQDEEDPGERAYVKNIDHLHISRKVSAKHGSME